MTTKNLLWAGLFYCGCLALPAVGRAQYVVAPIVQQGFVSPYSSGYRPTVSPYLNLVNQNQNVVTSYQTLVRPMMEERDALARQGATRPQGQQRPAGTTQNKHGAGAGEERVARGPRFLNYSHYFGEQRR